MVNAEVERQFGYRQDEMVGQSVDILVPTTQRAQHAQHRAQFAIRPEARKMGIGRNLSGQRKDGTEFPIEVGLNPIETPKGIMVLTVIIDISERQCVERLKNDFVATVSHELRTPLTSIAGALSLLVGNAGGTMPAPMARLIKIAHANSQRLVRLVNTILEMEKIASGKVAFALRRVDIRSLVLQTIEANLGLAESCGVQLTLDAGSTAAEMRTDPDWMVQVITNLLSNAIKFSPRGGEVAVAIEQRERTLRITVRDHGHGIPDEFKPRIFERFAQADATDARQMGGTGLGLTIVKQIVTRLGGTVGFDDAPGGGAIFFVELPDWEHSAKSETLVAGAPNAKSFRHAIST